MNPKQSQTKVQDLSTLTTTQLVINLAKNIYSEEEKRDIISIVYQRESVPDIESVRTISKNKPPKKGTKAYKIFILSEKGMGATEIYNDLNKKQKIKTYYPEIYRVINKK